MSGKEKRKDAKSSIRSMGSTRLSLLGFRKEIQRAFREGGRRRGQALTEFALTVPVMVVILLFAIFFYEINHLKIKTQEMARYAAWEFTGFPLHDYGETNQSTYYTQAASEVRSDFDQRFANLESTNMGVGNRYLMVSWQQPRLTLRNEIEPNIPSGRELGLPINLNTVFNLVTGIIDIISMIRFSDPNPVLEVMMGLHKIENDLIFGARKDRFNPPRRWGFNEKGYIHATVSLSYRNEFIPRKFMGQDLYNVSRQRFRERSAVVADSWRLHYGDSIDNESGSGKPYWEAVERMAWVSPGTRTFVRGVGEVVKLFADMIGWTAVFAGYYAGSLDMDPMKTALVSKPYKDQDPSSGQIRINEDSGGADYDTSPNRQDSDYRKTFEKRGGYFMGCPEPESLTCGPSLSTNNPFGDFVVPPPE